MTPQLKWYYKNREKAIAKNREWQKANPERHRENVKRWQRENRARTALYKKKRSWKHYGIDFTEADYAQMLAAQAGLCKICQKPCKSGRKLAVDHCHTTGKVRGLLCAGCNITLGHIEAYKESPERWDNYLKVVDSTPVAGMYPLAPEGFDPALDGDLQQWCIAHGISTDPRDW